jgi:meiotic recombination protein SPO11
MGTYGFKRSSSDRMTASSNSTTVLNKTQAKGYPDLNSRKFLCRLANTAPHIPIYAFVDLDPDGIAIMSTYKYGSHRLAHEDTTLNDIPTLSLPNLSWLGLKSHQLNQVAAGGRIIHTDIMPELQGVMKLAARDRIKATHMLQWDLCVEGGPEEGWRKELQTMLMLNIKAEMQVLDELPGGMVSWLSRELGQATVPRFQPLPDMTGSDDRLLF